MSFCLSSFWSHDSWILGQLAAQIQQTILWPGSNGCLPGKWEMWEFNPLSLRRVQNQVMLSSGQALQLLSNYTNLGHQYHYHSFSHIRGSQQNLGLGSRCLTVQTVVSLRMPSIQVRWLSSSIPACTLLLPHREACQHQAHTQLLRLSTQLA